MNGARPIGTVDRFDVVANNFCRGGRFYPIRDAIGTLGEYDIGKRVFWDGEIVTVENNGQRDKRLAKEANREE